MELYQLRTYAAVAEEGRLSLAAERLHASLPAVSAHIKALEDELGVELFERSPRGMALTPIGERLLAKAREALAAADALLMQAKALKDEASGVLRIGLNSDPAALRVTDIFERVKRDHPLLELHLQQSRSDKVPGELRRGELDAGFIFSRERPSADLAAVALQDVSLAVGGPASWRERILGRPIEDLAEMPWLWIPACCPFQEAARKLFEKRGLSPKGIVTTDDEAVLKAMVSAGQGLAVMRRDEAVAAQAEGKLCVWDGEMLPMNIWICCLEKRAHDPSLKALMAAVKSAWERAVDQPANTATV